MDGITACLQIESCLTCCGDPSHNARSSDAKPEVVGDHGFSCLGGGSCQCDKLIVDIHDINPCMKKIKSFVNELGRTVEQAIKVSRRCRVPCDLSRRSQA